MNTNSYDNYCSFTIFLFYYIIPMFYYVRCMQVHVDFKGKLNDCSFGVIGMFVLCWVGVGVDMCICQCVEREWKLMFFCGWGDYRSEAPGCQVFQQRIGLDSHHFD